MKILNYTVLAGLQGGGGMLYLNNIGCADKNKMCGRKVKNDGKLLCNAVKNAQYSPLVSYAKQL